MRFLLYLKEKKENGMVQKLMQSILKKLLFLIILFNYNVFKYSYVGLPAVQSGSETKPEFKDEKRYPNGTVIGTYTYIDKEGTPVHVQYYADNNSYGYRSFFI